MDLRQLEYFLAIAKRRSFTAAASELGLTQPSLTKTIRALEQELSVQLFERLPRGVELTSFGNSLLHHAEAMRVQVQDARNEIEELRGGTFGLVTIGAGPAWLRRHLPKAVSQTLARNPGIKVRIESGYDEGLISLLRRGEVDFVVAELPTSERSRDLDVAPLTSDGLGVCCRAKHPLARARSLALKRLLDYPWIKPPRSSRVHRRVNALFVAADLPAPEPLVEAESMAFQLQMLRESDALTYAVHTTLLSAEAAGLTMLNVPQLRASREAGIISRRGAWLSPATNAIISELKKICAGSPRG